MLSTDNGASLYNDDNRDARPTTSASTNSAQSYAWGAKPAIQSEQHAGPNTSPASTSPRDRPLLTNDVTSNTRNRHSSVYSDRGVPRRHASSSSSSGNELRNDQRNYKINDAGCLDETLIEDPGIADRRRISSTDAEIGVDRQLDGRERGNHRDSRISTNDVHSPASAPMSLGKRLGAALAVGVVGGVIGSEIGFGIGGVCGAVTLPIIGAVPGAVVGAAIGGAIGFLGGFFGALYSTKPEGRQAAPPTLSGHLSAPNRPGMQCYHPSSGGNESDASFSDLNQDTRHSPKELHRNASYTANDSVDQRRASRRSSHLNPMNGQDYEVCMKRTSDLTDVRKGALKWYRRRYPRKSRPPIDTGQMVEDLKGVIGLDKHLRGTAESGGDYEIQLEEKTFAAAKHFISTLRTAQINSQQNTRNLADACASLLYMAQLYTGVLKGNNFSRAQLEETIRDVLQMSQPADADGIPPEQLLEPNRPASTLYQAAQQIAEGFADETGDDKGCRYAAELVQSVIQCGVEELASNSASISHSDVSGSESTVVADRLREIRSGAAQQIRSITTAALLRGLPRVLAAARNIPLQRPVIESSDQSML
jgi:hypothetical protein